MIVKKKCYCSICGKEFDEETDCLQHEKACHRVESIRMNLTFRVMKSSTSWNPGFSYQGIVIIMTPEWSWKEVGIEHGDPPQPDDDYIEDITFYTYVKDKNEMKEARKRLYKEYERWTRNYLNELKDLINEDLKRVKKQI